MSQTPLTDAHVVSGPTPWIPAEAAREIEMKLRDEIAAANRKSEVVLRAVRYAAGVEEGRDALEEISQMKRRIRRLIEERDSARIQADHKWKLREEFEALLGTSEVEVGVEKIKKMKAFIDEVIHIGGEKP